MRERRRTVVLLYHRIGSAGIDPQLLSVTPEHFAEHLRLIAERYTPARLADLVAGADGRAPPRGVVLTFDDGYADNLLTAKPLLEREGIAATVFVVSGYVGSQRLFWWDELEQLLLQPGRLPSALTLNVGGETLVWELGEDATYASVEAAERVGWTVLADEDPGPRQRLYRALCARLRGLDETARERVLERLRSVAQTDVGNAEMPRPLTPAELTQLADGGLVDIGAHTVSHPVLAQLGGESQREEIAGSKRQLEEMLGRPVSSFAYPYGSGRDFDDATISFVRDAGFAQACANVAGRFTRRTDPFRIPRLVVRDWSGDELCRRLSAFAS